ncbi:hypothetical protein SPRG_11805 [Saprolegnia parasitica CBS 223.65]|uniref:Uncharacterized protein n=1 Tax=Saprolegnia parasitica (strain CBS 223.65) TaxID=695850 RepID=A0A067BXE2_SAPPC|nr:hypothetical protein SPRG_11805 [Saprolegnia parasitica CBS 223.65]KDO22958.1 hypothetical protein SPRG_11805 [Saprolegnia parasitica CBS 223.65]|eukprot:XP_012206250.1 hypothetical protein SPRG_11805 [Saprolegnia parasitica CBS 223.65]
MAEDLRRLEHVRLRNRLKQQRHKARYVHERDLLRDQVEHMTQLVASWRTHPRLAMVSWRDTATGLRDAAAEAQAALHELRRKHRIMTDTVRSALTLAASISRQNNVPSLAQDFAWARTTLLEDPTARRLGLDWFTQHMYFNTDRMLARGGFPSQGSFADVLVQDCGNDCVDVFGRVQAEYSVSLEAAYAFLAPRIWSILRGDAMAHTSQELDSDITAAIDPSMVYRRYAVSGDDSRYYAAREFRTPDRIVFLLGNMAQDELQPTSAIWRPRRFWFVLERQGDGRCRMRFMWYNGPYVVQGSAVPWDQHIALTEHEYDEVIGTSLSRHQFQTYLRDKYSDEDHELLALPSL